MMVELHRLAEVGAQPGEELELAGGRLRAGGLPAVLHPLVWRPFQATL